MKRYYNLIQNEENKVADLYIYGDITSYEWDESDTSSFSLSKELQELKGVEKINVYINSYGGEVKEGLAIYNALKRHNAEVTTFADGFACSIASVIFAAGDERVMNDASLLMIHNAWSYARGDSEDLRKQADDLEKITQASINAYLSIVDLEEEDLKELMKNETWLDAQEAVDIGFATQVAEPAKKQMATQSVRNLLMQKVTTDSEERVVAVVDTKVDSEELGKIVQEAVDGLKKELFEKQENELEENKPKNMLQALFTNKEEK